MHASTRTRRGLAALVAALGLTAALPGIAAAAPVADISSPGLEILAVNGVVAVDEDTATVSFVYKCSSETPAVLWASAKQLVEPDAVAEAWDFDTHGTSMHPDTNAWYDTHDTVACDAPGRPARARHATVEITRATYPWGRTWDQMTDGVAYVQLCLSTGDEENGGFAAFYEWRPTFAS